MNSHSTVQERVLGHQNNYLMHHNWVTFVESLVCSMYMYHTYSFPEQIFLLFTYRFSTFFQKQNRYIDLNLMWTHNKEFGIREV